VSARPVFFLGRHIGLPLRKAIETMPKPIDNLLIQKDIPLSSYSTYRIGGKAAFFAAPSVKDDLEEILTFAAQNSLRTMVFGSGSNILFPDEPADDLLFLSTRNLLEIRILGNSLFLSAGVPLSLLAYIGCMTGEEKYLFTYLLPGTMGAGVYMNAKCYDDQVSGILKNVEYIDLEGPERKLQILSADECCFAYKKSIFQEKKSLITGIELKYDPHSRFAVKFQNEVPELRTKIPAFSDLNGFYQYFSGKIRSLNVPLPEKIRTIETDRVMKKHFDHPSCGSVFKNNYAMGVPTGQLIDRLGLKGKKIGGAKVSDHHGNFIINEGGATAADVHALIDFLSEAILKNYQFKPETEVVIVQ
jgi:UDP-N-acetylmuramate dehydrogenase